MEGWLSFLFFIPQVVKIIEIDSYKNSRAHIIDVIYWGGNFYFQNVEDVVNADIKFSKLWLFKIVEVVKACKGVNAGVSQKADTRQ